MSDRPQYPSYPGDDQPKPPEFPAGQPVYGQEPASAGPPPPPQPAYGQVPPGYGQVPPGYGQVPPGYGQVPPPPPGYGPPPGFGYARPQSGSSAKAVWGLVLGIISIAFCYVGVLIGPAAIIVSVLARKDIDARPPGAVSGRGMATAGLVTGIIGTVLWGAVIVLLVIGLTVG